MSQAVCYVAEAFWVNGSVDQQNAQVYNRASISMDSAAGKQVRSETRMCNQCSSVDCIAPAIDAREWNVFFAPPPPLVMHRSARCSRAAVQAAPLI